MRTIARDLRFAGRMLRNSPGFAVVAVLTLALGIAAATTVFSWIDGLLLRPFPGASRGDRLAVLEAVTRDAPNGANQISYMDFRDFRQNLKLVSDIAAHREDVFNLGDEGKPQGVWGELVSGNYFDVLGVEPEVGRLFAKDEDDEKLGAHPLVVISNRLWRSRFRGDPAIVGKNVRVNRREMTIIGVTDRNFRGTMPGLAFDIWVPITMGVDLGMIERSSLTYRGYRNLYALARLRDGVAVEQAGAEAGVVASQLTAAYPKTNRGVSANIVRAWRSHDSVPEFLLAPLRILMAVSVVLLLIVCSNVTNLLLARSVSRSKELGIRMALGAGRGRLARQLLTETVLLAGAGAITGIPLAFWMADSLPLLVPSVGVPVSVGFQMNGRVMFFAVAVCVLAAMLSGAAPALFSVRLDVSERLREGGRAGMSGVRSHRLRNLLVMSEVALATVALIVAGLFLRSFENARRIDPGFDRSHLVLGRFFLATTGYSLDQLKQFCALLRDRLAADPGVAGVSYSDFAPLGSTAGPYNQIEPEGYIAPHNERINVNRSLISPGYFQTFGIPLLEGREFTEKDDVDSLPVAIVNQTFARWFFNGANPVGRRIRYSGKWTTIVGLVKDSKYFNAAEAPHPFFYAPFRQRAGSGVQLYFEVRTAGDPRIAMGTLRREVAATDPNASAFFAMPMTEWTDVTLLPQRIAGSLVAALGLIALVLAAVGLYSVMAYAVSQRTQEIGVRMALGARSRDVLGDVLRKGMTLTLVGLAAGLAIAAVVTRFIGSMLVNVGAADPATYAGAAVFLTLVAMLASYVPARRATRIDPMHALRCE